MTAAVDPAPIVVGGKSTVTICVTMEGGNAPAGGAVSVTDPNIPVRSGETPTDQTQGPAGAPGPPGPAGAPGAAGAVGAKGDPGVIQSFTRRDGSVVSKANLTLDDIGALGVTDDASATKVLPLGAPAIATLAEAIKLNGFHARMWGVVGDGRASDGDALQKACTDIKAMGGVTDGTPKSWRYPVLRVSGDVQITSPLFPTNHIKGMGRARLFTNDKTISIIDGRQSNDPVNFGFTRLVLEDLTLQGGLHAISVDNANIDNGLLDFIRLNIGDTADYALYVPSAYSTVLNVDDSSFLNCNGDIWTQTDVTNVRGGWSNPIGTNFSPNRAVWNMAHDAKYHQIFNVSDWTGVPNFQTPVAGSHWVDVRGNFSAIRSRFGGEFGGIPIAWNYTAANSDAFGNTDASGYARGGSVSIRDCWAYAGPTARADSGAIVLRNEAPTSIVFEGNVGPLGVPVVYNAAIPDPAAYFTAWRAATGKTDEADYFDWRVMDRGARASALVPVGFAHLLRRPARSLVAQATISGSQSFPSGEVQIALNTTTFDAAGLFSVANKGFVAPASGVYDVQALLTGTTTTAAGQYRQVYVRVNNNLALNGVRQYSGGSGQGLIVTASGKLFLNRGDIVTLWGSNNGGTDTIQANASATNLTISGPI